MQLSKLAPKLISKCEFASESNPGMINANVNVTYGDKTSVNFRIVGICENRHSICYEVISAEPDLNVYSVQNQIICYSVTESDQTFIRWITDFSNDVDLQMIEDNKYKKLECFREMKTYY